MKLMRAVIGETLTKNDEVNIKDNGTNPIKAVVGTTINDANRYNGGETDTILVTVDQRKREIFADIKQEFINTVQPRIVHLELTERQPQHLEEEELEILTKNDSNNILYKNNIYYLAYKDEQELIYSNFRVETIEESGQTIDEEIFTFIRVDLETANYNVIEYELATDADIERLQQELDNEIERATEAEQELDEKIEAEIDRATDEEARIEGLLEDEVTRATEAEGSLQDNIDAEARLRIDADKALTTTINTEREARESGDEALNTRIDNLDLPTVGQNGSYLKTVSQENGQVTAQKQAFDTDMTNATDDNAPTTKNVKDYVDNTIDSLDKAEVGEDGKYIKKIKEDNGIITATLKEFDTLIDNSADNTNTPTTKAVKDYVDAESFRAQQAESGLDERLVYFESDAGGIEENDIRSLFNLPPVESGE